jgi:endoglycosylceramidase
MRRLAQAGASVALLAVLVWSWSGPAGAASDSALSDGPAAPVSAPGGSFLRDAHGRVVLMHGVDLVYKLPPYEIVTSDTGVNVVTNAEAASIASDGFDVVRLGILW